MLKCCFAHHPITRCNLRATDVLPVATSSVRWACERKENEVVTRSSRPRSLQASFACCTYTHMSMVLQRAVACTHTDKSMQMHVCSEFITHPPSLTGPPASPLLSGCGHGHGHDDFPRSGESDTCLAAETTRRNDIATGASMQWNATRQQNNPTCHSTKVSNCECILQYYELRLN
jgi:hypothetical protein